MNAVGLQTAVYVLRLGVGRETYNRADRDVVFFGLSVNVALRHIGEALIVDNGAGLRVKEHARSLLLSQEFERVSGTYRSLACENDDRVGLLRIIHDKKTASLAAQNDEHEKYNKQDSDSHSGRMLLRSALFRRIRLLLLSPVRAIGENIVKLTASAVGIRLVRC